MRNPRKEGGINAMSISSKMVSFLAREAILRAELN
jgi:hypothetical protein